MEETYQSNILDWSSLVIIIIIFLSSAFWFDSSFIFIRSLKCGM